MRKIKAPGQAHHVSQNAAFKGVIPKGKGLAVKLEGRATADIDSAHYNAHEVLEKFWEPYRSGGRLFGKNPTVGQYNRASYESLISAGFSKEESTFIIMKAYEQQKRFHLTNASQVPHIPGPTRLKRRW